jgi:mycothiol synthase
VPAAIRRYAATDRAAFHELLRDPGIAPEYARLLENGELDDPLAHPILHPGGVWLAVEGDRLAGFSMLLVAASNFGPWAYLRLAVRRARRRQGIGTALLAAAEDALAAIPAERSPFALTGGAWLPADGMEPFFAHHAFSPFRTWWELDRPPAPVPDIAWPDGIEPRTFDGSDHAFAEWAACHSEAFGRRFPSHLATAEEARRIAAGPRFRADGLLLAWRGDRCVGFCRDTLLEGRGEVDVLAVRPDAQGIGLGRALLRWGIAWLRSQGATRAQLVVDGENEAALALYRSEGFEVAATRAMWMRKPAVPVGRRAPVARPASGDSPAPRVGPPAA